MVNVYSAILSRSKGLFTWTTPDWEKEREPHISSNSTVKANETMTLILTPLPNYNPASLPPSVPALAHSFVDVERAVGIARCDVVC